MTAKITKRGKIICLIAAFILLLLGDIFENSFLIALAVITFITGCVLLCFSLKFYTCPTCNKRLGLGMLLSLGGSNHCLKCGKNMMMHSSDNKHHTPEEEPWTLK